MLYLGEDNPIGIVWSTYMAEEICQMYNSPKQSGQQIDLSPEVRLIIRNTKGNEDSGEVPR